MQTSKFIFLWAHYAFIHPGKFLFNLQVYMMNYFEKF